MKITRKSMCFLASTVIAIASLTSGANAAVTVVTSGTGAAGNIAITVLAINFAATSAFAGGFLIMAFDEAQMPSGAHSADFSGLTLAGSSVVVFNEAAFTIGSLTAKDSLINTTTASPFSIGDIVTLSGGSLTMVAPNISADVFPSGSYEVFLINEGSARLSANGAAVPEPSSSILVGLATLGLAARRRRNN